MPCAELDESRFRSDAPALRLGRGGEILGADEVRGGLLLPGDLAGCLSERREGLTRETAERLLDRGHGAGSEPMRSAWDCPASGITEVTYSS